MGSHSVDIDVLWAITAQQPMLWHVEHFLTHADEPDLQSKLNKLSQDVGIALAETIYDPEDAEHPSHHHEMVDVVRDYEPVTAERLRVLDEVGHALEVYGSEHVPAYEEFLANMKSSVPLPRVVVTPVPNPPSL